MKKKEKDFILKSYASTRLNSSEKKQVELIAAAAGKKTGTVLREAVQFFLLRHSNP